jgi:hypothetical protein
MRADMTTKYFKTKYPGVRYRLHPTRKDGIKPDMYFAIYYYVDGKRKDEGLGWASKKWTAEKANSELSKLLDAKKTGKGPRTMGEARGIADQERQEQAEAKEQAEKEAITLKEFYKDNYLSVMTTSKKPGSIHAEKILYAKWIKPYIGAMPIKDIYPLHIEKIKKTMTDEGKAPRSIEYVLSVIRQIWNLAKRDGFIDRDSPTKQVKKPKFDNKRLAYFTHEQADKLLSALSNINESLKKN